jgi:uncharacterized protein
MTMTATADALKRLEDELGRYESLVVAFSGGADSALLAYVATSSLGRERVLCATAVSPSLAQDELADVQNLASEWRLDHVLVDTHELDDPEYAKNDLSRCFYCKQELMEVLVPIAEQRRASVALGVNLDDLGDWRPGQKAAADKGGVFPFVDARLDKTLVREISKELGLRTWDKPAAACLSSRVPHGTPVTVSVLSKVDRAEAALRRLGFSALRVRHYDDTARVELEIADLHAAIDAREAITEALHRVGYRYVTLDLEGLRSGNLSQHALAKIKDRGNR